MTLWKVWISKSTYPPHLIKNIRLSSFPNQMRPNSTNLQKNQYRYCIKKTFEYMNISRKCKFICSNSVIVASFQIEFNKYKYLQKLNILETKKPTKKKNYLWHMMSIQISQNCKTKNKKSHFI